MKELKAAMEKFNESSKEIMEITGAFSFGYNTAKKETYFQMLQAKFEKNFACLPQKKKRIDHSIVEISVEIKGLKFMYLKNEPVNHCEECPMKKEAS